MNYLVFFCVFFINFILQTTVFRFFEIMNVIPNTTLVLVIIVSFLCKERYGIVYGIIFGLLQDIFFGEIVGVAAFIYFTIGIVVNDVKGYIYKDTILSSVLITAVSVTYYHLAYWLLMRLFDMNIGFMYILRNVFVIEIFYDILVSIIIYKILFNQLYTVKYK